MEGRAKKSSTYLNAKKVQKKEAKKRKIKG